MDMDMHVDMDMHLWTPCMWLCVWGSRMMQRCERLLRLLQLCSTAVAMHSTAHRHAFPRAHAPRALDEGAKIRLAQAGFAIPGMESAAQKGAKVCTQDAPCDFDAWSFVNSLALSPGGLLLLAFLAYRTGVAAFADETDGMGPTSRPVQDTPSAEQPAVPLSSRGEAGTRAGAQQPPVPAEPTGVRVDTADENDWLKQQAERSRARRQRSLRDFAARLRPVEDITGWSLATEDGMPKVDAFVFLAVVGAIQIALLSTLADVLVGAATP